MKLWQKIALVSLLIVILSVSFTALFVSQSYFSMMIQREKDSAAARHAYISTDLENRIAIERLRTSATVLSDESKQKLISDFASERSDADSGVSVFTTDGITVYRNSDLPELSDEYTRKVKSGGLAFSTIIENGAGVFLIVGSSLSIENSNYLLYTFESITTVYQSHRTALGFIRTVSVIFAVLSAFGLLLFVWLVLRPLNAVNASIRDIAGGNYSARIKEKGGTEIVELSRNVNSMAQSIEDNVEELQGIADSRKRFVDNLAHEMKTPLTSIVCLADVMRIKKQISDKERTECADIIVEEAQRLKNLSGKLLELTVAGNAELDFKEVNIREILASIETAFTPIFDHSYLYLEIHPIDAIIKADRELFSSLLYNLIDNARKACSVGGTVEVTCKASAKALTIRIIDNGVGMSKSELKRITEPFYMADKSRSRKAGGAGLGLSLCMEIAKRHHASFRIDSEPNIGTTVTVTVPLGGVERE